MLPRIPSGTQLIQDLIEEGLSAVHAMKPDGDKIMRLHAQTATIENGFVHLPTSAPWLTDYLHELTIFPNGRHDDQVDSTAQALAWTKLRPPGWGTFGYYRLLCERLEAERIAEATMVRLRIPDGVTYVHTFSGNPIRATSNRPGHRIIELSAEDAAPLKRAGWTEVER